MLAFWRTKYFQIQWKTQFRAIFQLSSFKNDSRKVDEMIDKARVCFVGVETTVKRLRGAVNRPVLWPFQSRIIELNAEATRFAICQFLPRTSTTIHGSLYRRRKPSWKSSSFLFDPYQLIFRYRDFRLCNKDIKVIIVHLWHFVTSSFFLGNCNFL